MGVRESGRSGPGLALVADSHSQADELIDGARLALRVSGARKCRVCMDDELYAMVEELKARCIERKVEPAWDSIHKVLKQLRPAYAERGPAVAKSLRTHADDHSPELRALAVAR